MRAKPENIVRGSPEALAWLTPDRRAALDALADDDIAAQIAANPDAAPEAADEWFAGARRVGPHARAAE